MKKRILVFLLIIITLFFSMFIVNRVKSEILKLDIANSIKNFLNNDEYCKYFGEDQFEWLETVKRGNANNYDITEFIDYFIEKSKRSIETHIGMNDEKEYAAYKKIVDKHYKDISIVPMCYWFYKYFDKYITEEDIKNYKNNTLEKKIIEKLKSKLNYNNGKWYIGGDINKEVELLYGFYLNYIPDNRIEIIKPKNILDIKVLNDYIYVISYDKDRIIELKIKYIDYEDNIIECKNRLSIHVKDKKHLNVDGLSILYYKYPNEWILSQLQVCHHSKDLEDDEFRKWEEAKIENEPEPSEIIVDTDFRRIDIFKKYNRYNNCEQYASIMVDTYEDGSSKSYFRKFIVIKNENEESVNEYMQRELPYRNKKIDEVMELYLNDKEQYIIDEELLKYGNELVEYKKFTLS